MPVYEVDEGKLAAANPKRFCVEGLRERIGALVEGGYRSDRDEWPSVHQALVRAMFRIERALKLRLNPLRQR